MSIYRQQIGDLLGRLRDLDQPWAEESVHQLLTDKTTLQQRVHQLTREHRTLQERLDAARSNNRFLDRRVADLEAQLAEKNTTATLSNSSSPSN